MDSVTTTARSPPRIVYIPVITHITVILKYILIPKRVFSTIPPANMEKAIWITMADIMEINVNQSLLERSYLLSRKSGRVATPDLR
ncbi:hypothetical protein D3C80_1136340 [compost metagenome]